MSNQMHVVQPIGKFGAAYLLSKKKYVCYRLSSVVFYFAVIGAFLVFIAAPAFGIFNNILLHEIISTGLVVASLGVMGMWRVLSSASVVVGETEKPTFEKSLFLDIANTYGLACCIIFLLIIGFIIIVQLFLQHTVDPKMILYFLIFLILAMLR